MELREVARPDPDPDGIVVRVRTALTCGTDLKALLRGHPKFPVPTPFGHEFAGDVAEIGFHVKGIRPGDAIMAAPTAPCGACYLCARQQENLCPQVMEMMVMGAYADYVKLPAHIVRTNLYQKPIDLPYAEAALLEPLSCVLHGLSQTRLLPDDRVVVIGAGAFALLHVLVLLARGLDDVLVVTRGDKRARQARKVGAGAVFVGGAEHAADWVKEHTAGRGADLVIECTGQVGVWEIAPSLARVGGRVILFGGCPAGSVVRFDTARLHYDQVEIASPFHFTPRQVREAWELLSSARLNAGALISGAYALEDLPQAFEQLQRGEGAKYAIVPDLSR